MDAYLLIKFKTQMNMDRFSKYLSIFAIVIVLLVSTTGCSDGRPKRVPIAGTVVIDAQPLTFGSIMFIHPESRASGSAIDSNGHFQLTCYQPGDGAVLGKHRVKVTAC